MCNHHIQIIETEISALYNLPLEILNIMIIIQSPHSYSHSSYQTEMSLPTEHGVINPFTTFLVYKVQHNYWLSITSQLLQVSNYYDNKQLRKLPEQTYSAFQMRKLLLRATFSSVLCICICVHVCVPMPATKAACASHERNRLELFAFKSELLGGLHIQREDCSCLDVCQINKYLNISNIGKIALSTEA